MPCPICNRVMCDHTPAERGQTHEQMMADYQQDFGPLPSPQTQGKKAKKKTKAGMKKKKK